MGVELQTGNATNKEGMRRPMEGSDWVFRLAAWYPMGVATTGAFDLNRRPMENAC